MEDKNKRKVINVKDKNENEILDVYKNIAETSRVQNIVYDEVGSKDVALKLYELYKNKINDKEE